MKNRFLLVMFIFSLLLFIAPATASVLTEDNMPSVNSIGNLPNNGLVFTDGEYIYTYVAPHGFLKRMDSDLEYEGTVQDSIASEGRYTILGRDVYFVGRKKPGIYKMTLDDGDCISGPQRIINANILCYALDENGIYYYVSQTRGIWRADHNGENRVKLSDHTVKTGNNIVRMIAYEDNLYYVNDSDHCLYAVPCDGSAPARKISSKSMHYFVIGMYKGEPIIIYAKYASTNQELYNVKLRVIDMEGNPVEDLSFVRNITSRYFNYMGGYLYYTDEKDHKYLKRVPLNASSHESETLIRQPTGYILAFDGWVVASYMTTDMYEAAYFFIDLETKKHYKVYNLVQ